MSAASSIVIRALNPLEHFRPSADLGPPGDQGSDDAGAARGVRILIGVDLNAAVARLVDAFDQRHRQAPARRSKGLHVSDDARKVTFLRNPDHFLDRCNDADVVVRFVADVTFVDAAHLADDSCQRDHFVGRRVAARRVVEAGRQADAAGFHAARARATIRWSSAERGRAIAHAKYLLTDGAVRNVERDVHADATLLESGALGA